METIDCKVLLTSSPNYKIYSYKIKPPIEINSQLNSIGLDPGTTHMGVAYIWRSVAFAFEIEIERSSNPVIRILETQAALGDCIKFFDYAPVMTIEGSSFGSNYRNTELAEVRASAVLWAVNHGIQPQIIQPTSIRKTVFGSGKIKAEDTWEFVSPNAASALACACYPFKLSGSKPSTNL